MGHKKKKRNFCKEDGFTSEDLLIDAHGHLASAHVLFTYSPSCYFSGGYLAHLGIELIFKAYLLHLSGSFQDDHDLEALKTKIEEAGGN